MSQDDGITNLPGGAIRFTTGSNDSTPDVPSSNAAKGVDAGTTTRLEGDNATSSNITRVTSYELRPITNANSVLQTARSASGRPLSGPELLRADATVCLVPGNEGTRTSIKVALREGYLEQDQLGNLREVGVRPEVAEAATAEQQRAAAEAHRKANELPGEDALSEAFRGADQGTYTAAVVHAIMNDGEMGIEYVHALASQTGKTPVEMANAGEALQRAFTAKAAEAAYGAGVDNLAAFQEWAQTNRREQWHNSMLALALGRDSSHVAALAREFTRTVPPSQAEIEAAGFRTEIRGGVLVVEVPGVGWSSAAALARDGAFKRK